MVYKAKMLYAAYPLYCVGVLAKEQISLEYRKTVKRVLGLPMATSNQDLNNILFEADMGDIVELV